MHNRLQSSEEFDEALWEELQVSHDFSLTLCAIWIRVPEGLDAGNTRSLLDVIRVADLAAAASTHELAIMLPNTSPGDARKVAERLLEAVPGAEMGESSYRLGDVPETLLDRARESLERHAP